MIKDTRCDDIRINPAESIPVFFINGWLGGTTLKNAITNARIYRKSKGRFRQILDGSEISDKDYVLAAEQAFLYGRAGRRVIVNSLKAYINFKVKKYSILDYSHKLVDVENDICELEAEKITEDIEKEYIEKVKNFDKNHVWMFDAGHNGRRDFRGNPKYLFVYINKYRSDIFAYWYCEADAIETINLVRKMGFCGVLQGSQEANMLLEKTGVVVSEQLREYLPQVLLSTKYLNLWHGIGFKRVERSRIQDNDDLRVGISKKYISYNKYLMNNQLLVVNSPIYEKEFIEDFGISESQVIRTGYLRCLYQQKYEPIVTFDHDIKKIKGVNNSTKLAVYAPTFRANRGSAFSDGIKDIEKLYKICEEKNILLIFKVHPHIEKEPGFLAAADKYREKKYFLFWDNANDFYEIMNKIELVIYDYSSIFSDFLCAGVKNFIRYIYDEEEYMSEGFTHGKDAYYDRTCGIICKDFDELLVAMANYETIDMSAETESIYHKLWQYTGDNDFEKTIQATLDFKPSNKVYPTLYSFDIFDTLISRKGLHPYSIFYKVAERMKKEGGYSEDLVNRYAEIRHSAEMNVREYYIKTTQTRHTDKIEIQMYEIFERLSEVYGLVQSQAKQLMDWEIEEEIKSVIPIQDNIDKVMSLKKSGKTVILISDMYLPRDIICKMLSTIDNNLTKLPLFVSSEYGVQKTSRLLYFEIYRSFNPFYNFERWIHYGDNTNADKIPARALGITTVTVPKVEFNSVEKEIIKKIDSYDSYLLAAICARLKKEMENKHSCAEFVIDIVGNTLIPYVDMVLKDAIKRKFEVLYFIARDGYFLKIIADSLIESRGLNIETRYLYASRRTWRVQSYIYDIDETFWISQGGNFSDIHSKEYMLKALYIDEETFKNLIPQVDLDLVDWEDKQPGQKVASIVRKSKEYKDYLLRYAEKNRELPSRYLLQEIEFDKKYAFVEYWGRGYNQNCMTRLLSHATNKDQVSYYYYARSILPSDKNNIRYDMTNSDANISLFEPIFANMPYLSIEEYCEEDGIIKPIIKENPCFDKNLYNSMGIILKRMAGDYGKAEFINGGKFDKELFDFMLRYSYENRHSLLIAENMGNLRYSMSMYGKIYEYAPAYTMEDLNAFLSGKARGDDTHSIQMSYGRAPDIVKEKYDNMYQVEHGEDPFKSPMLKSNEIKKNIDYSKKYDKAVIRAETCKKLYEEACKKSKVFNKVTVVSTSNDFCNDSLYSLKKVLNDNQDLYVEWISASILPEKDSDLIRMIAMAKYLIIDGNVVQLLKIHLRPETMCIALLDRGFRLYNFGKNEKVKLKNQYKYDSLLNTKISNVVEITSMNSYENSGYTINIDSSHKLNGACITDVLFDTNYKNEALEKIHSIVPESIGKKLIIYMPLPRRRKKSGDWMEILDIERLAEKLGDEYYLLCDFRSNNAIVDACKNTIDIPGFSKNMSRERISLRSLLAIADIVVGDYRDTFFEAALLGKPVFSTAVDIDEIQSTSQNLMYELREMYPFKIIHNSDELIDAITGEYDYRKVDEFKSKFLIGCDGKCANRLYKLLLQDKLSNYLDI